MRFIIEMAIPPAAVSIKLLLIRALSDVEKPFSDLVAVTAKSEKKVF